MEKKVLLNRKNIMRLGTGYGWDIFFDINKNDFEEFETITISCLNGEDKVSIRRVIATQNETKESIDYQLRDIIHYFQRDLLERDIKNLN